MNVMDEKDFAYRHGTHGPKYLMKGPESNFGIIRLLPGEITREHVHRVMEENFYVLEGTVEIAAGGGKAVLTPGQFAHIGPGEAHTLRNIGSAAARLVLTAAPFCDGDKYSPEGQKL